MTCRLVFLVVFCFVNIGSYALPINKRSRLDDLYDSKHALQGVEVNGLFNPMER